MLSDTICSSERVQKIIIFDKNAVDVQVDMIPAGRRTVTTFMHPDGSKTIACKIRQVSDCERVGMDPTGGHRRV
jgi:hypothetical protein